MTMARSAKMHTLTSALILAFLCGAHAKDDGFDYAEDEEDASGGEDLVETTLWKSGDASKPEDHFPGALILLPDELSKITKFTFNYEMPDPRCGWSEFIVAYDTNDDVLMVSVDKFVTDDTAADLRKKAIASKWAKADIHPDNKDPSDIRKGNGFPGLRLDADAEVQALFTACSRPVLEIIDSEFDFDDLRMTQTMYGLVSKQFQPGHVWLDSQRLPHNDINWQFGVHHDAEKTVPTSYASVLSLTDEFQNSGTSLYLEKSTGYSLLKTLPMNEAAQGAFNPHVASRKHAELDLYKEIPDPYPHSLKHTRDNAWVKTIMIGYLRYNRCTFYDGRRLHNQYMEGEDYPRLTTEPDTGRLTMNSFWWSNSH